MNTLDEFQTRIGYRFRDVAYLRRALTHSSRCEGKLRSECYERQEFLGDSILSLVVSTRLFTDCTDLEEGQLTKIRAAIVCEQSLAKVAKRLNIGNYLFLGKGEEQTGGRERISILADVVEAIIAAIFLDGGFEAARDWTLLHLADLITDGIKGKLYHDSKTRLQEILQGAGKETAQYRLIRESGPAHSRIFTVEVIADGVSLATGSGRSKKEAEQNAATAALEAMDA